jgi:hypothetical protein
MMDVTLKQIDVPRCDGGAPCPMVVANEGTLVFGYYDAEGRGCVIIEVPICSVFKFGYPNDEVLHGHRYAKIGLAYYSAYEVLNSEWIREMMVANRIHSMHTDSLFDSLRHFIFTFHDSTLEFVAREEFTVRRAKGELRSRLLLAFDQAST